MRNVTRLALVGVATALAAAAAPSEAGKPGGGTTPPADPRIAYESNGALCVANADGTEPFPIVSSVGTYADPNWSPDGQWIVFRGTMSGPGLYKVKPDGTSLTKIHAAGTEGAYNPHWSPRTFADGKARVLFNAGGNYSKLWAVDTDGNNLVQLTTEAATGTRSESYASWSPDGTRIVVGVGIADQVIMPRGLVTFTVNDGTGAGGAVSLSDETTLVPPDAARTITDPEWSRTSTTIGNDPAPAQHVVYDVTVGGRRGLEVVNVSTGGVQTLASSSTYEYRMPCWSPDDRQVLCRRQGGKASEDGLWVLTLGSTLSQKLLVKGGANSDWRR